MNVEAKANYKPRKWYNNYEFPLVPVLTLKKGNEHNTSGFTFKWLFFKFWSLDAFGFELGVVADNHWGIGFIGILPYLRWVICIPCPIKLQTWIQRKLWRKP